MNELVVVIEAGLGLGLVDVVVIEFSLDRETLAGLLDGRVFFVMVEMVKIQQNVFAIAINDEDCVYVFK